MDPIEPPGEPDLASRTGRSTGKIVAAATGLMIFTITLSRILGFARESLLVYYFGQGALTDVYKQSFIIPDTLYFLIAGGALSSAFIPVFTKYMTQGKDEDAWKTFSIVATAAFVVTTIFIVLGEIFTVPMSRIVSPGFAKLLPEQVRQMAYLTRIVLPAQIFFFMGGLMMGSLYSRNRFLAPAFGPLIYTVGIIVGGLLSAHFHPMQMSYIHRPEIVNAMHVWKDPHASVAAKAAVKPLVEQTLRIVTPAVSGYSWGALVGAFIGNFCVQLVAMRRIGMRFRPSLSVRHPGAKKVFALMLPVVLGLSLSQVDVQLNKFFASYLIPGSITALDNANRLMQLPYGILGTALAIALFPTLSALAAQQLWPDYRYQISHGIRRVIFMSLPASVLMMVLAIPAVRFAFQHGTLMTAQDTKITAITLVLFCAGVFAWCMQAIIARGFYAMQDTLTVVVTGTIMTVLFVGASIGFVRSPLRNVWWAPAGMALITTVAAVLYAFALLWILRRRIGGIDGGNMLRAIGKMLAACAVMVAVTLPMYYGLEYHSPLTPLITAQHHEMKRLLATTLEIVVVGGIGVLVYGLVAKMLRLEELESALAMFLRKFRRDKATT